MTKKLDLVSVTSMRNAEGSAATIARGYNASTRKPDLAVFVLDRCSDDTESVLVRELNDINYLILKPTWNDSIFAAGRPRDYAVNTVLESRPQAQVFCFLDGDCVPSPDLFKEHEDAHTKVFPYPCLVNGMRVDENIDGAFMMDPRLSNPRILCPGIDTVIGFDEHLYVDTNMIPYCWGCNVSLNINALKTAQLINDVIDVEEAPRAFNSGFDGQWGGEDPFLAATLFRVGCLLVGLDPNKSSVRHLWHDARHRNRDHVRVLVDRLRAFKQAIQSKALVFDHTDLSEESRSVPTAITQVLVNSLRNRLPYTDDYLNYVCSRTLRATRIGHDIPAPDQKYYEVRRECSRQQLVLDDFTGLAGVDYWTLNSRCKEASGPVSYITSGMFR